MTSEERRPRRFLFLLLPAMLVIMLFVLPEKLEKETYFVTKWFVPFNESRLPAVPLSGEFIRFSTNSRMGYLSSDGTILLNMEKDGNSVIGSEMWSVWDNPDEQKKIQFADGHSFVVPEGEIPFFSGARIFTASSDSLSASEYSRDGKRLWSYAFPCHVSAFDANASTAVFGLVNGDLVILGNNGQELSTTRIGGSRIEVILGLSISASGRYIAVMSGVDKQRLVLLEKGQKSYRIVKHKYLDSDYRKPVRVLILPEENYVFYNNPKGVSVFGIKNNDDFLLPIPAEDFSVYRGSGQMGLCIMAEFMKDRNLFIMQLPKTITGRIRLPKGNSYVAVLDDTIYLDNSNGLAALSLIKDE